MKRIFFLLFVTFAIVNQGFATKVISSNDEDWDNPASWNTNAVPLSPDTIIIRHYITYSRNLTINAPTVLIIEEGGTLCGDYLLDVACGASVFNYGHWYVKSMQIRTGYNYNTFYSKVSTIITGEGCSHPGQAQGFYNVPPNGNINIWQPTLCKTSDTNWPRATTGIPGNGSPDEFHVALSPNPLNSGYLNVSVKGDFKIVLHDTNGALLYEGSGIDRAAIDLRNYANGFYFVTISSKNRQVHKKILVQQ